MKKIKSFIFDFYFKIPIIIDFFVGLFVYFVANSFQLIQFKNLESSDALDYTSNLIGTCISLAGFLLASLTIIVTFKANLKSKGIEDSNTALELLFNTDNYLLVVNFFKKAIIELIINVTILYFIWLCINNFSIIKICIVLLALTIITIMTIWRSLFVLFKVLHSDTVKKE